MAKTPPATTHLRIHLVIRAPRKNRLHVVKDPNATCDHTLAARKNMIAQGRDDEKECGKDGLATNVAPYLR
jgi:hypothetical protein